MAALLMIASGACGELLYTNYLLPSFADNPDTEYSGWDIFYAANTSPNYPDFAAPNGIYDSASVLGFTPPPGSSPLDPSAFWHAQNPTITQTVPGIAFIIAPTITGNIYSFRGPTSFVLEDETPFPVGTVVFQFQTAGNLVDFSSIALAYDDGETEVILDADEYIREYESDTSGFGGSGNRNALQWDLRGRNVSSYRIIWRASGSSMSLQEVSLDTSADYALVVPEARTWEGIGSANWSDATNWAEGSPSQDFGNVRFANDGDVIIAMSSSQTVGECVFDTSSDVTIENTSTFVSNTGLFTRPSSTGTYTIKGEFEMCAYNLFEIEGGEVVIEGAISGASGLRKEGEGVMILRGDNSFGSVSGGIGCTGGELRIEGVNQFTSSASVLRGDLVLAGPAPVDSPGTLGNASSDVAVGADSGVFGGITTPARLIIEGDHEVARGIAFAAGIFDKRLGARGTGAEAAEFSGAVTLRPDSTETKLFAEGVSDLVNFSGNISGGDASLTMEINPEGAEGTVRFSGADKTYENTTFVRGGFLELALGTSISGEVILESDTAGRAVARGSGIFAGGIEVAEGGVIAPGIGVGTLGSSSQNWDAGGACEIEIMDSGAGPGIGWDLISIDGVLGLSATPENPFLVNVRSLTASGEGGPLAGFSPTEEYSWKIVETTDGVNGFRGDAFTIQSDSFNGGFGGVFAVILEEGNSAIHLTYTPATGGSTVQTWLAENFNAEELSDTSISGWGADRDSDGLSTLLEYALGGDPKSRDPDLAPVLAIGSPDGNADGLRLSLTFKRLLDRSDIDYRVQAANSLEGEWMVIGEILGGGAPTALNGGTFIGDTPNGNTQEVTFADAVQVGDAARRFVRLQIERRP